MDTGILSSNLRVVKMDPEIAENWARPERPVVRPDGVGTAKEVEMIHEETLISRAREGDQDAFRHLTDPHCRELQTHCYRMLGSFQDAEDALQETLLAAWRGFAGYEERASVRTWLYRIATNRCLNARRATRRRLPKEWDVPGVQPPEPTRYGEVVWLEPLPDSFLEDLPEPGPEARYELRESVGLALITAIQQLPPRQLAVLVLRDTLGFRAAEVAEMLDTTVESVTSALKRARANLERYRTDTAQQSAPQPGSPAEEALVAEFVAAYETSDIDRLVALLTDDAFITMPPMPFEYVGAEAVGQFCAPLFRAGRKYSLIPTRANGQPAFGVYVEGSDGLRHGTGVFVLTLAGDRISAMTRFENTVLPSLGLPRQL
jgi:RNA polymerase sigma-70 factor (TIGR02960 family)